jgi:hypothetical protein
MHLANRHTRRAILRHLEVKLVPAAELKQLGRETRQHPPGQIQKIVASVRSYGLVLPILVDAQNRTARRRGRRSCVAIRFGSFHRSRPSGNGRACCELSYRSVSRMAGRLFEMQEKVE